MRFKLVEEYLFEDISDTEYIDWTKNQKSNSGKLKMQIKLKALKNGFNLHGYHGTPNEFNLFDLSSSGTHTSAKSSKLGIFISSDYDLAKLYSEVNTTDSKLNLEYLSKLNAIDKKQQNLIDSALNKFKDSNNCQQYIENKINELSKVMSWADTEDLKELAFNSWAASVNYWEVKNLITEKMRFSKEFVNLSKEKYRLKQEQKDEEELIFDYTPHIMELYINIKNPLIQDFQYDWHDNSDDFIQYIMKAHENKNDGCIFKNTWKNSTTYVVFNSAQLKLADCITYDDNNKIIPISERFNIQLEDIRF